MTLRKRINGSWTCLRYDIFNMNGLPADSTSFTWDTEDMPALCMVEDKYVCAFSVGILWLTNTTEDAYLTGIHSNGKM